MENAQITVNVTPNGYADALTRIKGSIRKGKSERKVFVKPLEEKMSMSQFLDRLKSSKHTDDAMLDLNRVFFTVAGKTIHY